MKATDYSYLISMFQRFGVPVPPMGQPWDESIMALIKAMLIKIDQAEEGLSEYLYRDSK